MDNILALKMSTEDYSDYSNEDFVDSFPIPSDKCFYGITGSFAKEACLKSEADPMAVLLTTLTWVGAYFGQNAYLQIGDIKQPPRLNVVLVGKTAKARKGTSVAPVRSLTTLINHALTAQGLALPQYSDGPMSTGEGLAHTVRDAAPNADDSEIRDKRLMLVKQEFGGSLKVSKREGNSLSAAIRSFWDNGSYSPLTKRDKVIASDVHFCFVGHVTSDELFKHLNSVEISNGFANRILWAAIKRSQVIAIPESITNERLQELSDGFVKAIIFSQELDSPLTFSEKAKSVWIEVYPALSKEQVGTSANIVSRAEAQVLRVATIFALIDCSSIVKTNHLMAALSIWDFCQASVYYVFGETVNTDEVKVTQALTSQGDLSQTQISHLFAGNKSADQLRVILDALVSSNQIESYTKPSASGKGRKTIFWKAMNTNNS